MALGGWLGGAIVFVHGMRVLSLVKEPTERAISPVPHAKKRKPKAPRSRVGEAERLLERRLRLGADRGRGGLPVLEEDHRRDRLNAEALGERGLLVDVHLDELEVAVRSSTIRSSTGATAWHGPHHSAQKSTITGLSLWRTSCSKLCSVTAVAMILSLIYR